MCDVILGVKYEADLWWKILGGVHNDHICLVPGGPTLLSCSWPPQPHLPHFASPDLPARLWVLKCPGNLSVQSCLDTFKVPGNAGWLKQDQLRMEGLCSVPRDWGHLLGSVHTPDGRDEREDSEDRGRFLGLDWSLVGTDWHLCLQRFMGFILSDIKHNGYNQLCLTQLPPTNSFVKP